MMKNKYNFCKSIYEEEALKTAINDFGNIAQITYCLSEDGKKYIVTFKNCILDLDKTQKEFANYVLMETIRIKRIAL